MLIPRHIFAIHKATNTESSRYALGAVRVEREHGGQPIAIATDGRRLVMTTWRDDDRDEYPASDASSNGADVECLIPVGAWKEAQKLAPRKTIKPILGNVALNEHEINGTVKLTGSDLETTRHIEPRQMEGRFPRWRDVLPEYDIRDAKQDAKDPATQNQAIRVTLDHRFLAELASIVHETSGADKTEARGIDLIIPLDTNNGVVFECESPNGYTIGVLMPLARDRKPNEGTKRMLRPPVASSPPAIEAPEPKALPAPEPEVIDASEVAHDDVRDSIVDGIVKSCQESPVSDPEPDPVPDPEPEPEAPEIDF